MMCRCRVIDFISDILFVVVFFFFKQKTAYEMRISDWSSDVCSSDLPPARRTEERRRGKLTITKAFDDESERQRSLASMRRRVERERKKHMEIGRASCRERACQYV